MASLLQSNAQNVKCKGPLHFKDETSNHMFKLTLSLLLLCLRDPEERAFFNSTTGRCEEFTGCPGSGNNFDTLKQCQQICEGT